MLPVVLSALIVSGMGVLETLVLILIQTQKIYYPCPMVALNIALWVLPITSVILLSAIPVFLSIRKNNKCSQGGFPSDWICVSIHAVGVSQIGLTLYAVLPWFQQVILL